MASNITLGFLTGFFKYDDILDVSQCLDNTSFGLGIEKAFHDFEAHDYNQGVIDLRAAMEELSPSIDKCAEADEAADAKNKIAQIEAASQDAAELEKTVIANYLKHPIEST